MSQESPRRLRVEYTKSSQFRVAHVDGAIGGTTPHLDLFIDFYSERFPIPKVLVYELSADGRSGEEIVSERESKEGVIRESEIGVVLNLQAAQVLSKWLADKVIELEQARNSAGEARSEKEESK